MPDNQTIALVKAIHSPALARVSNQLTLTDKLLIKPDELFLIPYRKGDKWGFCDWNKNVIIDCVYDKAFYFHKGVAEVVLNYKYGLIDKTGNFVVECIYDDINSFSINSSLIRVGLVDRSKRNCSYFYGYINRKGSIVVPTIYDGATVFVDGLSAVITDQISSIINEKNEHIISGIVGYVNDVKNNLYICGREKVHNFNKDLIFEFECDAEFFGDKLLRGNMSGWGSECILVLRKE